MKKLISKMVSTFQKQQDLALLLLRVTLGALFIETGIGKFQNFGSTVEFFTSIGIPFADLNVFLASATELFGGLLVLLGVFTPIAVIPCIGVMIVALLTAHLGDITSVTSLLDLKPWYFLIGFLVLGAFGSGRFSIDFILKKIKK